MVQKMGGEKNGGWKKFVHRKIAQPPLKYLMVRPLDSFVWNTNMAAMAFVELVSGEWVQTLYRVSQKTQNYWNNVLLECEGLSTLLNPQ
jgi:hypothetical protein